MVTTAINSLISAAIGALISAIVVGVKGLGAKRKAEAFALNALTRDAYFRDCRYVLEKDELTPAEFENVEQLRVAYKGLGMNGTGDWLWEQVKAKHPKIK